MGELKISTWRSAIAVGVIVAVRRDPGPLKLRMGRRSLQAERDQKSCSRLVHTIQHLLLPVENEAQAQCWTHKPNIKTPGQFMDSARLVATGLGSASLGSR